MTPRAKSVKTEVKTPPNPYGILKEAPPFPDDLSPKAQVDKPVDKEWGRFSANPLSVSNASRYFRLASAGDGVSAFQTGTHTGTHYPSVRPVPYSIRA